MSRPGPEPVSRALLLATVFAAVAVAAGGFLGWEPRLLGCVWVAGSAAAASQAWLGRGWREGRRAGLAMAAWAAAWGGLLLALRNLGGAGEGWHASYVMGAGFVVGAIVDLAHRPAEHGWAEDLRLASLVALAVWLFRVYLTSDFFGGVDARSYGYAMIDALQQARAGIFPVFVGQGEYMFDGAIHPIRTAPYHQHLGVLLDALTWHALPPLAVQHLTVVWTAIQGVLTCYVCLTALEPSRRGLAWLFSVLYLCAPAAAAAIYGQEMYMTYMAFAYLPWAIYGNILVARDDTLRRWCGLAAALAVVWFCHPPVATWLSIATFGLQGLRLIVCAWSFGSWVRAAAGTAVFGALTVGYFWSIFELSARDDLGRGGVSGLGAAVAAAAALIAIIRHLTGGRPGWLLVAAGMSALAWSIQPLFGQWLGAATLGALALGLLPAAGRLWRKRLPETAVALLLLAGLLVLALPGFKPFGPAEASLGWVRRLWPMAYLPVSVSTQVPSDVQLGYALLAATIVGAVGLLRTAAVERRLLGLVAIVWLMLCLPLPGLTRFLLTLAPLPVYAISSDIAWLRYLPTMVAVATFAGFLGLASWDWSRGARRWAFLAGAVLAVGWSFAEAEKFPRHGAHNVNTREVIDAFYRPENARQFAYIFAGMPVSPYLTNGVVDYHLESRLLRADDPMRELPAPSLPGAVQTATLRTSVDDTSPAWLHLQPSLVLDPGEHVVVQFEFFNHPYEGTLICRGPKGFYREYLLPTAGFFEKSFGVAPERPKTITLWNERPEKQPVEFLFVLSNPAAAPRPFGDFARIRLQPFQPAQLPVRTLGLIPAYRAEVQLREPAYLETLRAYIPGYRAVVNGQPVEVQPSPNHMAMVRLNPGANRVELRYAGTAALRSLLAVSLASWLGLGVCAWRWRGGRGRLRASA